jgi:hypothetical protein
MASDPPTTGQRAAQIAAVRKIMGWDNFDLSHSVRSRLDPLAVQLVAAVHAAAHDDQAEVANDPERTAQPLDVAAIRRRAHANGYAEAVARLRDDERYRNWWEPHLRLLAGQRWQASARRHFADYLEAVAEPDQQLPTPHQTDHPRSHTMTDERGWQQAPCGTGACVQVKREDNTDTVLLRTTGDVEQCLSMTGDEWERFKAAIIAGEIV